MRLARFLTFVSGAFLLLASATLFLFRSAPTASAQTTTPPSSTISSTTGPLAWDFAPVGGGTVTNVGIQDICPPGMCDDHDLNIVLPSATFYQTMTAQVTFKYTWTSTVPTDLDIFAISPNGADHGPGSPDDTSTGPGEEDLTLTDPLPGLWHIRSVASLVPLPTAAHVVVTMTVAPRPTTPPPPPPAPGSPTFVNYPAPPDCAGSQQPPSCITPSTGSTTSSYNGAGEPSIGVDWKTGKVFIEAGNHTLRVTFNDSLKPASAFWEDKRSPFARVSLNPILFTANGVDLPVAPGTCGGLHGHVRVSPDGTAYVPNKSCMDANGVSRIGVAVSTDNGLSWSVRTVPDSKSISPGSDPSVAAGANNTIYLRYVNTGGHAKIAASSDRGLPWLKSKEASTPFRIPNPQFTHGMARGAST